MERHRADFSGAAGIIAGHADPLPHPSSPRRRRVRSAFDDLMQQRIFLEQRFVDCDAETRAARHVDVAVAHKSLSGHSGSFAVELRPNRNSAAPMVRLTGVLA
jgi:hypothetical protein